MASRQHDFDPGKWGYSLANVAELLFACLDAVPARTVVEVGAYKGELTAVLIGWAKAAGARVTAIEPKPPAELEELAGANRDLEVIRETSHRALAEIDLPDAVIIDGDHNWWTLTEELRILDRRAPGADLPLLMFHDVGWPHARRDTYYDPDGVPGEHRQPLAHETHLAPGNAGVADRGLPYEWAAEREGGERNGVLTALEDFTAERPDLRLAVVPAFFGFGVLWHREAQFAAAVEEIVGPWDRNALLERLEANRVHHLVAEHAESQRVHDLRVRLAEQERILRSLLESGAFALAERVSRVRQGGRPAFSKEEIRRALADPGD